MEICPETHATTKIGKFGENLPNVWRKLKNIQRGPLKRGDFDENSDLVKFAPQVEQNSNYMSKGTL